MQKIALSNEIPPIPKEKLTSKELEDFLLKCFIRDPKQRPNTSVLLQHPFVASAVRGSTSQDDYVPAWVAAHYSGNLQTTSVDSDGKGSIEQVTKSVTRRSTSSSASNRGTGTRAGSSDAFMKEPPASEFLVEDDSFYLAQDGTDDLEGESKDELGDTLRRFDQAAIAAAGAARFSINDSIGESQSWPQSNSHDNKQELGNGKEDGSGSPDSTKILYDCQRMRLF